MFKQLLMSLKELTSNLVHVFSGPTTLMMGQLGGNLIVTSGGLNRLDNIITMVIMVGPIVAGPDGRRIGFRSNNIHHIKLEEAITEL